MKKIIAWIIGRTRAGETVSKVQMAVDGKKQVIASVVAVVVSGATILNNFSTRGTEYLIQIGQTMEFATFSAGIMSLFNAFKGEKIRKENAEILEKLNNK